MSASTANQHALLAQVIGVTPPADAWVEQLKSFGVPELAAKDLANM